MGYFNVIKFKVNFYLSASSKVSKGSGGSFEVIESEIKRKSQTALLMHERDIW